MYTLSAFSNISIGALSWRNEPLDYNRRRTTRDRGCLNAILTFPFAWLWTNVAGIFSCLFSCLPKRMQRPIRFSGRFTDKWGYHKKSSVKIKLRQIPSHRPRRWSKKKGTDKALGNVLLYDIVLIIAPKVHYVDLVNLSMVSKRVRAIMFPVTEDKDKDRRLRLYSCYGNRKSGCWTCGIQICDVSSISTSWGWN